MAALTSRRHAGDDHTNRVTPLSGTQLSVREFPLEHGALQDPWHGNWDITSKGLEIRVGDYNWCGHPNPIYPGLYQGAETGPSGTAKFNCVTYRLRDAEAINQLQGLLGSDQARAAAELLGAAAKGFLS